MKVKAKNGVKNKNTIKRKIATRKKKLKIPKNKYDVKKHPLYNRVVNDVLDQFRYVDANGIPIFKSISLTSDYYGDNFTYGFMIQIRRVFAEKGYFTDISYNDIDCNTKYALMVGIEPVSIPLQLN